MSDFTLERTLKPSKEDHIRQRLELDYDTPEWREYRHDYRKRGRAVIANFNNFECRNDTRKGSEKDVSRLECTLRDKLKFDVCVWDLENATKEKFMEMVKFEANRSEHVDGDCFLMVIMTHGDKGGLLMAYDKQFQLEEVVEYFTAEKCRGLRSKPKIFIIQACRGNEGQKAVFVSKSGAKKKCLQEMITIPSHSDILIAQAQYEGFFSLRNPRSGSYFIQALCEVLDRDFEKPKERKDDILRLLTFVSHYVANFEFWERQKSVQTDKRADQAARDKQSEQTVGDWQEEVSDEQVPDPSDGSESDEGALKEDAKPFIPTSKPSVPTPPPATPSKPTFGDAKLIKQQPTIVSTLLKLFYFRDKDLEAKQEIEPSK